MATASSAARLVVGALPSILLVVAVFLLGMVGLALGPERRQYALAVMGQMLSLAAVLVGVEAKSVGQADPGSTAAAPPA